MRAPLLLVIDVLNDFFEDGRLASQRTRLASAINGLVRAFREHGRPVVWVRQEFAPDLSDAFLDMRKRQVRLTIAGTEGSQLLRELDARPDDPVIVKRRYSAFFGTYLDDLLAKARPDPLVVAGVNTHACVRTTVIDAYQRDYEVVVAHECVASYDEEHDRVTRRYLAGKMARFLSNAEIASLLASAPSEPERSS